MSSILTERNQLFISFNFESGGWRLILVLCVSSWGCLKHVELYIIIMQFLKLSKTTGFRETFSRLRDVPWQKMISSVTEGKKMGSARLFPAFVAGVTEGLPITSAEATQLQVLFSLARVLEGGAFRSGLSLQLRHIKVFAIQFRALVVLVPSQQHVLV